MLRIFYKNKQKRITNITINTPIYNWNQRRKLRYLQLAIRKAENYIKKNLNTNYLY